MTTKNEKITAVEKEIESEADAVSAAKPVKKGLFSHFEKPRKKNRFFLAVEEQARISLECVRAVITYCDEPTEANGARVQELENEGDNVRKNLIITINKTFMTPIDREDLFQLSLNIDDIADYMWTTIMDMRIYGILPDQYIKEMIVELEQMANYLYQAVGCLEFEREKASKLALKAKKLENVVNTAYHNALAVLYESDDIKKILKYREIYNHLNNASDRGDEAANSVMNISVKL